MGLVAAKQRVFLELLAEKRQSLTTRAVTHGLHPRRIFPRFRPRLGSTRFRPLGDASALDGCSESGMSRLSKREEEAAHGLPPDRRDPSF